MISKILVAIDGSAQADHVLNFALELADKCSAEIHLLTVIPTMVVPVYSIHVITSGALKNCANQLEKGFEGVLSKALEKVMKNKPNLNVFTKLEKGHPDEKIIETAKRGNFDIIIMGSRGLGRRDEFIGSVSYRVANKAACPVVIVK